MLLAAWIALLGGATLAGVALVAAMALPRGRDLLAIVAAAFSLSLSVGGLVAVWASSARVDEIVVGGFLGAAAFFGGFALGGALLSQLGPPPATAALSEPPSNRSDLTGVVLLAEAEPAAYEPRAIARELRGLADDGVDLPPEPARAFVYLQEKARYRALGGSTARETVRAVAARLDDVLAAAGGFAPVAVAWCDDEPYLDQAVAGLAGRGIGDVVVADLAVTSPAAAERARRRVDGLRAAARGVRVAYAATLWASGPIATRIAARAIDALGDTPLAEGGIAVLGYGRPAEILETDPAGAEHETVFHQRVRGALIDSGIDAQRVRIGWVEWQEPGVTEVVRHLAALGCRKIVAIPASMPVDTVSTMLDIREEVAHARIDGALEVELLPAWGDDPVVAEALGSVVREAAAEFVSG